MINYVTINDDCTQSFQVLMAGSVFYLECMKSPLCDKETCPEDYTNFADFYYAHFVLICKALWEFATLTM